MPVSVLLQTHLLLFIAVFLRLTPCFNSPVPFTPWCKCTAHCTSLVSSDGPSVQHQQCAFFYGCNIGHAFKTFPLFSLMLFTHTDFSIQPHTPFHVSFQTLSNLIAFLFSVSLFSLKRPSSIFQMTGYVYTALWSFQHTVFTSTSEIKCLLLSFPLRLCSIHTDLRSLNCFTSFRYLTTLTSTVLVSSY